MTCLSFKLDCSRFCQCFDAEVNIDPQIPERDVATAGPASLACYKEGSRPLEVDMFETSTLYIFDRSLMEL